MTISRKRKKEIEAIADKDIDYDDIPETDSAFWASNVARELEIVAGIERGLNDMKAGRVVAHGDIMADIDATIEDATRAKTKKRLPKR